MISFGTRPEAIKMCPFVNELKTYPEFSMIVCLSGQYKELLKQVRDMFGVVPDNNLAIMQKGQTLFYVTMRILEKMKQVLEIRLLI